MSSQAIIVDRTRIGTALSERDYALDLTTTDISRTINIGSNWQRIRIGFRWSISSSAAQNTTIAQPQFAFGLCNGTGSTYSTSNTHFVGMDLDPQFYLINKAGTSTNYYLTSPDGGNAGNTRRFVVKINNTRTVYGSALSDGHGAYIISGSPDRTVNFLDFIKPTTGSAVVDPGLWSIYYGKSSDPTSDISGSVFYAQLSNDTASNTVINPITSQFVPVSESINGSLTTVNIYWSKNDPPLEISDVAVWRFA